MLPLLIKRLLNRTRPNLRRMQARPYLGIVWHQSPTDLTEWYLALYLPFTAISIMWFARTGNDYINLVHSTTPGAPLPRLVGAVGQGRMRQLIW